jgi:oxalate decarboxylase/phosphoglucose isomerase-like protein (cupin superfamily)
MTSTQPVHPKPPEVADLTLEEIAERYVARFRDRKADWKAFADAAIDGYHRAQHRFIGAGGSGKHGDPTVIPAGAFTLSVMYVPPGQGNPPHTHEVEEVFFVLKGFMNAFLEDETGRRVYAKLGEWECISCPAGVLHGFVNDGLEPLYFITMLGKGRPELMVYKDDELTKRRGEHLRG